MAKRVRLTNQEERFCNYYITCWNASKAVQLAEYDTDYSAQLGNQLLKKKHIAKRIAVLRAEISQELTVQRNDILIGVQSIAFDPNAANRDRLKAYDLLCKILGYYAPEQVESTVKQVVFNEAIFDAGATIEAEVYPSPSEDSTLHIEQQPLDVDGD